MGFGSVAERRADYVALFRTSNKHKEVHQWRLIHQTRRRHDEPASGGGDEGAEPQMEAKANVAWVQKTEI